MAVRQPGYAEDKIGTALAAVKAVNPDVSGIFYYKRVRPRRSIHLFRGHSDTPFPTKMPAHMYSIGGEHCTDPTPSYLFRQTPKQRQLGDELAVLSVRKRVRNAPGVVAPALALGRCGSY